MSGNRYGYDPQVVNTGHDFNIKTGICITCGRKRTVNADSSECFQCYLNRVRKSEPKKTRKKKAKP